MAMLNNQRVSNTERSEWWKLEQVLRKNVSAFSDRTVGARWCTLNSIPPCCEPEWSKIHQESGNHTTTCSLHFKPSLYDGTTIVGQGYSSQYRLRLLLLLSFSLSLSLSLSLLLLLSLLSLLSLLLLVVVVAVVLFSDPESLTSFSDIFTIIKYYSVFFIEGRVGTINNISTDTEVTDVSPCFWLKIPASPHFFARSEFQELHHIPVDEEHHMGIPQKIGTHVMLVNG